MDSRALFNKAADAIEDAKVLLQRKSYDGASDRAYYAAFNAVRAALLAKGKISGNESHGQVANAFDEHFAKRGILPRAYGATLRVAMETRRTGDYEEVSVTRKVAEKLIADVEVLLSAIRSMFFEWVGSATEIEAYNRIMTSAILKGRLSTRSEVPHSCGTHEDDAS